LNAHLKIVSVIGLGYIGLPTAALIASEGYLVIGVDVDPAIVQIVNEGKIHFVEPGLGRLVHSAVKSQRLNASLTPQPADIFLIAVPTPFKEGNLPDLTYIEAAAKAIAPVIRSGNLIVLESTSPVGATEALEGWLAACRSDLSFPSTSGEESDIRIAYCPERVLPGQVLHELVANDRVIGGVTSKCTEVAITFYTSFVKGNCIATNSRTAEMVKLTENAFRDVNIAFANELSLICDRLEINVWELISLSNHHPRVNILQPGPGVGGHCIAVDPWFIVNSAPDLAKLIRTSREVNDAKPHWVIDQVRKTALLFESPSIACLGLTFKPDIDDFRGSPALDITIALAAERNFTLHVVEPYAKTLPDKLNKPNVHLSSLEEALECSDIILGLVNHREFLRIDRANFLGKIMIDTRGMWLGT
jgi:UDP-N-acetyl-D-mannosaminuronic acid dehydrogenase